MSSNERNLLQRFNSGEEQAFNEIFRLYYRQLCFYIKKFSIPMEEAEDIVSDTFFRVFMSTREGKPCSSMEHIRNYLFAIARNAAINYLNQAQRQSVHIEDFVTVVARRDEDTSSQQIDAEMLQIIYDAVEILPTECKRIFKMHYLQERSYREIADHLQLHPQTVRNQKSRAVMLLRRYILKYKARTYTGYTHHWSL